MKFGKKLRLLAKPQWNKYYINYKELKQFIHAAGKKHTVADDPPQPVSSAARGDDVDSDGPEDLQHVDSSKQFPGLAEMSVEESRKAFLKRGLIEIRKAAKHVTSRLRMYRSKLEEASRDAAEVLEENGVDHVLPPPGLNGAIALQSSAFLRSPARPDPLGGTGLRPRGGRMAQIKMEGSGSVTMQHMPAAATMTQSSSSSSGAASTGASSMPSNSTGVVLASSVPLQPLDAKGRVMPGVTQMEGGSRVLPGSTSMPTASVPLAVDLTEVLAVGGNSAAAAKRAAALATALGADTPMSDRSASDTPGSPPAAASGHGLGAGSKRARGAGGMPPPSTGAAGESPQKKARKDSVGAATGAGGDNDGQNAEGDADDDNDEDEDEEDALDQDRKSPRAVQTRLLALSDQLEDLRAFMELNLTAAFKIGKKFDKKILRLKQLEGHSEHGKHSSPGSKGAALGRSASSVSNKSASASAGAHEDPMLRDTNPDGLSRTKPELERAAKTSSLGDKQGLHELADECEALIRSFPARSAVTTGMRQAPLQPVGTVQRLDVASLPVGRVSGMFVAMGSDPLQQPIAVPVMVARGASDGPVVMITSALHGNEVNGIAVIHRLFARLEPTQLAGTIVAVPVANPLGYVRHQRGYSDGTDLNRVFPGRKDGTAAQQFAHHFCRRILGARRDGGPVPNYLLDLHTASFGRVNSLYVRADMRDPVSRRMALLQNPQIIVHSRGGDGTLRGAASALGIASVTVEIGNPQRFHASFVELARQGVVNLLSHLGMVRLPQRPSTRRPIPCSRSFWIFTRTGGILSVKPAVSGWVRKGEVIAEIRDLFGVLVDRYVAPCDGVCVGKADNPVCQSGDRVVHIGVVEAGEGDGSVFASKTDDGHP